MARFQRPASAGGHPGIPETRAPLRRPERTCSRRLQLKMKRVLTAVALIPVVLLLVFKAPLWLYALVVAAIIVLALHEYLGIAEAAGIKTFRWPTYILATLPIILLLYSFAASALPGHSRRYFFFSPEDSLLISWWRLAVLSPLVFGIPLVFRKDLRNGLSSTAASVLGLFY